ncbi:MAG: hypothetical protein ACTHU0_19110 [Kofleriaceae bacterium]
MSDDKQRRRVQTAPRNEFEHTPITDVIERMHDDEAREFARAIRREVKRELANQQLTVTERLDSMSGAKLRDDVNVLQRHVVNIYGLNGNNGKLGKQAERIAELTKKLDTLASRAWWAVSVVLAGIVGGAAKLIIVGRLAGDIEAKVSAHADSIKLLQAENHLLRAALGARQLAPAVEPGKDH